MEFNTAQRKHSDPLTGNRATHPDSDISIIDPLSVDTAPLDTDIIGRIIAFENDEFDSEEEVVSLFQDLYDTGILDTLQGSYQRMFLSLLNADLIVL
jgi:hypothetical protein